MDNKIQEGWPLPEDQWSRFFEELIPTDEADTSASSFDKICVLASQLGEEVGWMYFLYYIDLSSAWKDRGDSIELLSPILAFRDKCDDISAWRANAVVGYKLFMFGGLFSLSDWEQWSAVWGCYDFGDDLYSRSTAFLDEKKLKKGPPMKGRKYRPIAAVVGGFKICVFSTLIYHSPNDDKDKYKHKGKKSEKKRKWGPPNFEVLDTRHGTWTELPELVSNYSKPKLEKIEIRSYCIEGSCLILCTDIGIYGIK